ncbi:MAG: biotin--[acetyl-CoA-carboxylase] ligase [Ruminococcaceae bacterium]|nr:biotin--[acetyl-CoA-carboxylase] ligase [Oscillospiraceae bacterium]
MKIYHYDTIDSTNAMAKRMILEGMREGVFLAEHQSAGRGRLGRSFFSENGIFMSMILTPERFSFDQGFLTSTVAVAVCRAIEEQGFKVGIKWVNDIYFEGKKICGILSEAVSMGAETLAYVVGIGINIGIVDFPDDIKEIAASLPLDENAKEKLFFGVLSNIECVLSENKATILSYLKKKSVVLGKEIRFFGVKNGEGIALDLDENGGLVVQTKENEKIVLTGGEISIRTK